MIPTRRAPPRRSDDAAPDDFPARDDAGDAEPAGIAAAEGSKRTRPARSLKARAIGYLSRREYSRIELARKLVPYAEPDESIDAVLDALEREGWQSNQRFAESLVHRRAARVGGARIVGELKRHAVDAEVLESLGTQLRASELERAEAVWRRKFGTLPDSPETRARQIRFLAMRGFSRDVISRILKGDVDED
jgi:regulatory protein